MCLEMMRWLHTKTHVDSIVLKDIVLMVAYHVLVRVMEHGMVVMLHVIEVGELLVY